jgi:hypothetical protein
VSITVGLMTLVTVSLSNFFNQKKDQGGPFFDFVLLGFSTVHKARRDCFVVE